MALPQEKISKLDLGLRRQRFQQELAGMKLPTDALVLIEMARAERERSLEGKYNLVFIFHQLEKRGSNYWTLFNCNSVEELLTRLDLPITATLKKWSEIVRLFSKQTILTLGEDSIFLLCRRIIKAQPDEDKQRRDFQHIFDEYNRIHSDFDKTAFEVTVNTFINTRYVKPAGLRVVDNTAPPPADAPERLTTEPRASDGETRLVVENATETWRETALNHIALLEKIIRNSIGKGGIPERPALLKSKRWSRVPAQ